MAKAGNLPTVHEDVEQINLFRWAILQECIYPELVLLHHIPNGGKREKKTGARLKMAGVKSGVPDIFLPVSRGQSHGLYIELKVGKNKTTENQDIWIYRLQKQGYQVNVCYGWEEAAKVILNYLKGVEVIENSISNKS